MIMSEMEENQELVMQMWSRDFTVLQKKGVFRGVWHPQSYLTEGWQTRANKRSLRHHA